MTSFIEFIFHTRTILLVGGFIIAFFGLLSGLIKKDKPPKWIAWLTFIGGIIVIIGALKANIEQEQSTKTLLSKTEIIANQAVKIAILSQQNIDKSEYIANTVTGGSSFCYIHFGPVGTLPHIITRDLVHRGEFPLYNISVRIVNLNEFHNLLEKKEPLTLKNIENYEERYYSDILLPNKGMSFPNIISHKDTDKLDFNIFFSARNLNYWVQQTRIRRVNGKWRFATRVEDRGKELLLNVSDGFPLNDNDEIDWE